MSTPVTSTKSINSGSPEAQHVNSIQNQRSHYATNGDSTSQPPAQDSTTGGGEGLDEEGYPPQKHAGAVGLGPEYGKMREAVSTCCLFLDSLYSTELHLLEQDADLSTS